MDLESIIWVAIFLVYIASIILKRIRRKSKAGEAPPITHLDSGQADGPTAKDLGAGEKLADKKRSRWERTLTRFQGQIQGKFGDFINEIRQEMEAAKRKDPKKKTGWEQLLPPKDSEPKTAAKTARMVADTITTIPKDVKKDPTSQDAAQVRQKVMRERMAQPFRTAHTLEPRLSAKKIVAEKKEPIDSKKEGQEKGLTFSVRDLRRAVIWSEILAPPLALRNDQL